MSDTTIKIVSKKVKCPKCGSPMVKIEAGDPFDPQWSCRNCQFESSEHLRPQHIRGRRKP